MKMEKNHITYYILYFYFYAILLYIITIVIIFSFCSCGSIGMKYLVQYNILHNVYDMCYTLYNSLRFFENIHLIIIVFEMIFHWSRVSKKNKKKNISFYVHVRNIFINFFCFICTNIFNTQSRNITEV